MSSPAPQESQSTVPKRSFWDICEEFSESLTPEELTNLPSDSAEQHDHYIYGLPKRNS